MSKHIKKYWYPISFGIIILIALCFRFYRYNDRWALAGDQARDAIVARVAYKNLTIPPLGPFSSAGNFTTGFIWYTWLIFSTALLPSVLITPWVILTISYTGIVAVMMIIGKKTGGKLLSLIAGLYTAISPAQINQSFNLTNPSLVAIFSVLSVYLSVLYIESGTGIYLFLLSIAIGLAISAHFQAVYLLVLIPLAILSNKNIVKGLVIAFIGLLLPFIPYIIVDIYHGFYNSRGIIDYMLYGQYKIYVPNRWLTYLFQFIPELWGQIIGGAPWAGFVSLFLLPLFLIKAILQKRMARPLITIIGGFLIMLFMLRFYRGERTPGYFVFIQPFILLTTASISLQSIRVNKYLGILLVAAISLGSSLTNINRIQNSVNYTYLQVKYWGNLLTNTYPGKKFDIYAVNPPNGQSLSLVLYLDSINKIDNKGYRIGFGNRPAKANNFYSLLRSNTMGYSLWDTENSTSAQLTQIGWSHINPTYIYETTTQWYKTVDTKEDFFDVMGLLFSKL